MLKNYCPAKNYVTTFVFLMWCTSDHIFVPNIWQSKIVCHCLVLYRQIKHRVFFPESMHFKKSQQLLVSWTGDKMSGKGYDHLCSPRCFDSMDVWKLAGRKKKHFRHNPLSLHCQSIIHPYLTHSNCCLHFFICSFVFIVAIHACFQCAFPSPCLLLNIHFCFDKMKTSEGSLLVYLQTVFSPPPSPWYFNNTTNRGSFGSIFCLLLNMHNGEREMNDTG